MNKKNSPEYNSGILRAFICLDCGSNIRVSFLNLRYVRMF